MTQHINSNNHLGRSLIGINRILLTMVLLCLIFPFKSKAQLDEATTKKLDAFFESWDDSSKPGVAGGIIHKGKIIYLKGFGSADVEQNIPITTDTKFHIGNLSKQVTAFAVLLLEEQGKVSLQDDIRKYLPELPEYRHKISIKDLLSQSSGLHEYYALKEINGWSPTAIFTQADALKLIATQTELDYKPGTQFSLTSTGMILLTEIIAKVTGQSFEEYAQKNIFEPLNMKQTQFVADPEQIIPNLAKSYQATESGYKRNHLTQVIPALSLYISAADLGRWYSNYTNPKVGSRALIQKFESPVTLKNGQPYRTISGELAHSQLFLHAERGEPKFWNYGLEGAYAANVFRFPNEDFTSFVIGNNNRYNGMPAMQLSFAFLEDIFKLPSSIDFNQLKTIKLSTQQLKEHEGHYWNEKGAYTREIINKNDTLRYARPNGGREDLLVPLSENTFQMVVGSDDVNIFKFETVNGVKKMTITYGESDEIISNKFNPVTYQPNELREFTGTFYCAALNTGYEFSLKDDKLTASHLAKRDITFDPVKPDLFTGSEWYFGSIQYIRDEQQAITGFTVSFNGVSNLKFIKINKEGAIN